MLNELPKLQRAAHEDHRDVQLTGSDHSHQEVQSMCVDVCQPRRTVRRPVDTELGTQAEAWKGKPMRVHHLIAALVGAVIIALWGLVFMCVCRVVTGKWWMTDDI